MENPRLTYAAGVRARPALLVRGSSRRITIMRFRPANIRVINRRDSRLGHHRCCVLLGAEDEEQKALNKHDAGATNELVFDRVVPYQVSISRVRAIEHRGPACVAHQYLHRDEEVFAMPRVPVAATRRASSG